MDKTIGHYEILEKISEGGMGAVYKARDIYLGRMVAIKIIPSRIREEDIRKKLKNEALSLSRLSHPNIALLYEYNVEGKLEYLVMEFVDGRPLSSILKEKSLSAEEILDFSLQIAEALKEAHSRGIVHRDIKPSNVMITPERRVKVVDFGISSFFQEGTAKTYNRLGTLGYVAPEVILKGEVTPRSDIFSFGVLLYRMVEGKTPYPTGIYYDREMNFIHPLEIKREVPAPLKELIYAMLREKPQERPDIFQVCQVLKALQQGETTLAGITEIPGGTKFPRWRWPLVGFVIVTLAIAGAVIYLLFFPRSPSPAFFYFPPFENATGKGQYNFLSFGLASEIRRRLSATRGFVFVPSSDVKALLKKGYSLKSAARKAGASWMVRGTLKEEREGLVLYYSLVNLKKGRVFEDRVPVVKGKFQEDVREVSESLLRWTNYPARPQEKGANPQAYELYLKGLFLLRSSNIERANLDQAREFLEKALSLEKRPEYYLALSRVYFSYITRGVEINPDNYRLCRYYLRRAREISPENPSVLTWEAYLDMVFKEPDIISALRKGADELERGNLDLRIGTAMGYLLKITGNFPLAERFYRFYGKLFPENDVVNLQLAWTLYLEGKGEEAISLLESFLKSHPDVAWARILLAKFLVAQGRGKEALGILKPLPPLVPVRLVRYQAENYPDKKFNFEPEANFLKAVSYSEDIAFWTAECYSLSGEKALALKYLKIAAKNGYLVWNFFQRDPLLSGLRQERDYRELQRKGMDKLKIIWEKEGEILEPIMKKLGI